MKTQYSKNQASYLLLFFFILAAYRASTSAEAITFNTLDQAKVDHAIKSVNSLDLDSRAEYGSILLLQKAREFEINNELSEAVAVAWEAHSKYPVSPLFPENTAWLTYYYALRFCQENNEKVAIKFMQLSRQLCKSSGGECNMLEDNARARLAQMNAPEATQSINLKPLVVTKFTLYGDGRLDKQVMVEAPKSKELADQQNITKSM